MANGAAYQQQAPSSPLERVRDMRDADRFNFLNHRRSLSLNLVSIDEFRIGRQQLLVRKGVESDGYQKVIGGVGAVAVDSETCHFVVAGGVDCIEDGVIAVDPREEGVSVGGARIGFHDIDMVSHDLLRRSVHVASIRGAIVADHSSMSAKIMANTFTGGGIEGFKGAVSMNASGCRGAPPFLFEIDEKTVVVAVAEIGKQRITVINLREAGNERAFVRSGIGDDEGNVRGVREVIEKHFFGEQAAETVRDEDNLVVIPDMLALEVFVENFGELKRGILAMAGRRGVLSDDDIGAMEVRIRLDELRPVGAVCGAPGLRTAVKTVHKYNDSRFESIGKNGGHTGRDDEEEQPDKSEGTAHDG